MSQNDTDTLDLELVRRQLESTDLDSLSSLQRDHGADNPFLAIDESGSMEEKMGREGKRRIDGLREVVAQLQGVPMIAFGGHEGSEARFVDRVGEPGGGTPLHQAIDLARVYGATRMVVISDGLPDDSTRALEAARQFGKKIDVVFVGDVNSTDGRIGSKFLDELARATGGTRIEESLNDTKKITGKVVLMLEGEVAAPTTKTVFTGAAGAPTTVAVEEETDEDDEDDDDSEEEDEEDDDEE